MLALRALLLILMTATLVVGGTARALPAPAAATPPCHEAPAPTQEHHDKSKPMQAPAAMSCCVGCMPAPNLVATVQPVVPAERPAYAAVSETATGRLTAPEPDPPRSRA